MNRCWCWQCQHDGFAELGLPEIVAVVLDGCLAESFEERDLMMAVAVADIVVAALADGFADTELVVDEFEDVEDEDGLDVAAGEGIEQVALAGAELAGLGVLSAEFGESAVGSVDDKQVEHVAQDDMIEASVVGHVAVAAAADCKEDTQFADAAAEEQVYAAAKCSGLVLQPVSQQVS
ncbi:hypothetical protein H9Q69_002961 [Fusarium xylarioides]|uniref:Uncharacterized protein n=1 Tax=Fusarium xylarioides TaxID=221167 RepID=A0A9P7I840_9HYPO|nr:hypothetical protein H9Q70_004559 [Fusarium xylarioides]KAG5770408.1 hypothetical protein H9Q72_002722 [Fusarium xylarioides]KAG5798028.1 hypothetical protein H9Q69_002961 [Fusarium xylarioides]KAG5811441.1 hypothetical protein H9Q71_004901 [Fusarium xylarioides]KAG5824776.1 hypothetical protein H9Q74_005141 [Fusarium xylarioides]